MDKNSVYDVVIIGGGVAGISCAWNCAANNLKTLLIEKENYFGGDVTGALVIPVMKSDASSLNNDFYNKLVERANEFNAQITYSDGNKGWFNPILLKCVFDNMLKNAGVDILFESEISSADFENKNVKSVTIYNKLLSLPIVSKYYVDTTGNASFAKLLNCEFWQDNNISQPESLRFIVSDVNIEKFADFMESIDSDKNITTTNRGDTSVHISTAFTWDTSQKWALAPYFNKAVEDNVLKNEDLAYFQLFSIAGMPHSIAFNCPRLRDYRHDDPFDHSNAIIEAREAIVRLHNFLRRYLPGFEESYIANIAPRTGERETRRVKCRYDYTIEDIINSKTFDNPAVHSNYPVDIHSNTKDKSVLYKVCSYMLPVESLMTKDFDNLYVAGKIVGADFKAQAALRVQSSCMSMGEAVAKDIAAKLNIN